jgi:4-hydroxy-tetrahydrodipicolinate synthase
MTDLKGILIALVTPFAADGSVDEARLRSHVSYLVDSGVHGIIPGGSTGEFVALSREERKTVTRIVIDEVAGRIPVIPHTGALSTEEVIDLSRDAKDAGAAALMIIPPYFEPNTWDEILLHFQKISEAVDLPIMYYHIPETTGVSPTVEEFKQLAAVSNVKYMKDSSGNATFLVEFVQDEELDIQVFNGWDEITLGTYAIGAVGSVWGAANYFPDLAVALYQKAIVENDVAAAREVWSTIWKLEQPVLSSGGYGANVKAALDAAGLSVGDPRLPALPAPQAKKDELAAVLGSVKVGA